MIPADAWWIIFDGDNSIIWEGRSPSDAVIKWSYERVNDKRHATVMIIDGWHFKQEDLKDIYLSILMKGKNR